jgi:hypothetical protein
MPFRFDDAHRPQVSNPLPGVIEGTLKPVVKRNSYLVEFFAGGARIADATVPFQAGPIPVSCKHAAQSPGPQPFQVNVSVTIDGAGSGSEQPIMLRN